MAKTGGKELKRVSSSGLRPAIREGANGEKISLERKARAGRSEGPTATMLWGEQRLGRTKAPRGRDAHSGTVPQRGAGGKQFQGLYHHRGGGNSEAKGNGTGSTTRSGVPAPPP